MLDHHKNQSLSPDFKDNRLLQVLNRSTTFYTNASRVVGEFITRTFIAARQTLSDERGDVPGWVLVVLMTTGLVTGIWTLAAPRIDSILKNSLDSMNGIR